MSLFKRQSAAAASAAAPTWFRGLRYEELVAQLEETETLLGNAASKIEAFKIYVKQLLLERGGAWTVGIQTQVALCNRHLVPGDSFYTKANQSTQTDAGSPQQPSSHLPAEGSLDTISHPRTSVSTSVQASIQGDDPSEVSDDGCSLGLSDPGLSPHYAAYPHWSQSRRGGQAGACDGTRTPPSPSAVLAGWAACSAEACAYISEGPGAAFERLTRGSAGTELGALKLELQGGEQVGAHACRQEGMHASLCVLHCTVYIAPCRAAVPIDPQGFVQHVPCWPL